MEWVKKLLQRFERLPRPAQLLAVVGVTLIMMLAIDAVNCFPVFKSLFYPARATEADVRYWSALIYALVLVAGLPVAFMLWHWRDRNVRDQIKEQRRQVENARKDTNLREFQEVQARAAGLFGKDTPAEAQQSLQIAATHQLAGFLKGEYGKSFQRPAWELLRAQLAATSLRLGYAAIQESHKADPGDLQSHGTLGGSIKKAIRGITLDNIGRAQHDVLRDCWDIVFSGQLPLEGTIFDGLEAPPDALLAGRDLRRCSFIGARLFGAHLEGAVLVDAHLEGADLTIAHLEGAVLVDAHLEGAVLSGAHLEGANLACAHLEGAVLTFAHLEGADLTGATVDDCTNLCDAIFDDATCFFEHWHPLDGPSAAEKWAALSEDEKAKARALWIARGMRHVNEPPPDV